MKTAITTLVLGALVFSASSVLADRGSLDTNADGVLSLEELQVARPGLTQERFDTFDTNGDGVLGEGERPRGRKFKQKIDTNGDGSIDLAELQAVRPGATAEKFAELDANNDGLLSRDERPRRKNRGEKFAALDVDGSGGLSLAEMKAGMNSRMEAKFARLDANGDGEISVDEHQSRRKERAERRKNRRQQRSSSRL